MKIFYCNPFRKTRCAKFAFLLILLIFVAMTVSCAGGKKRVNKKSILKGKHTIDVVKKSRIDYELKKMRFQHPYDFTAKEIFRKLISLRYEVLTIGGENKKIFNKKLARKISPYFVSAFKKAGKSKIVSFTVHSSRGQIIGDMFVYEGNLNIRFERIHSIPFQSEDAGTTIENWVLMLHKGEKYHKISKLLGKESFENWIILSFKTASVKASGIKEQTEDEIREEIQARFNRLKFLLDKGIITKEEYNKKKKELMDKYF